MLVPHSQCQQDKGKIVSFLLLHPPQRIITISEENSSHLLLTQNIDMYNEYKSARGSIALPKKTLLPISAHDSHQVCDVFGIHPNLPFIKELYDEKEAIFFSGVGKFGV